MKKFLVCIFLFFAFIAIFDFSVGFYGDYLQANSKGGATRVLNDFIKKDVHDVLVFGSSRAMHHYDTPFLSDTLGLDVYNAGYGGNGVILSYGLLELILERYSPKLIIYDVEPSFDINIYPLDYNRKRYLALLKPFFRDKRIGEIFKDVSKEEWYKAHSGMMLYNTNILTMVADNHREYDPQMKGYHPLSGIYSREPEYNESTHREIDSLKLEYMRKMIRLAQSRHITIVIAASPKYGLKSSEELNPIKSICEELSVPFLDYYADSTFMCHKEWFVDPMHLNSEGALVYSRTIVDNIKELINK